jgi:hypothetical protein
MVRELPHDTHRYHVLDKILIRRQTPDRHLGRRLAVVVGAVVEAPLESDYGHYGLLATILALFPQKSQWRWLVAT